MLAFLRISAIVGLVVFVPVLLAATLAPHYVERAARDFAVSEVRKEVDRHLETPAGRLLKAGYERLAKKTAAQQDAAVEQLASSLADWLAPYLARLCNLDCDKKEQLKASIAGGLKKQIARLEKSVAKLKAAAQGKFDEVTRKIRRDVMIFSGSNTLVFASLLALTFARRSHARALFVPAILMLASTVAAIFAYVFGQNWFFTILTDSYMGFGYLAYIAVIFFFLCDIFLNRARITGTITNVFGSV